MDHRPLGRTGWQISTISYGAWAIGGDAWGRTDDAESMRSLHRAADLGVNFIDTADVYGDGHSERLIGRLRRERREEIVVATKAGRRLDPHVAEGFTRRNLTGFVDRSLRNLGADAIDLLQLHCPPSGVYDMPEVFGILDDLVVAGKLRYYGVSVERVDEALRASRYPNVQSIQIIFNMFRLKPAEELFRVARERQIGVLARVPLASGLLSGKLDRDSTFARTDHRNYNRHGESFDVGETFSGVPYDLGLQAVARLKELVPAGATLAQLALRWIIDQPGMSVVIPGARNAAQAHGNAEAAALPPISADVRAQVAQIYDDLIRAAVHDRW